MANFNHLKALDVKDKTAEMTIYQIEGNPVLVMRPATEANKPYFNAVLKRSRKSVRALQAGGVSAAIISENRAEDRELFPQHVVVGWRGVKDVDGNEVPFDKTACAEFLEALPDWLFDEVRTFAGVSSNYTSEEPIDAETRAGN